MTTDTFRLDWLYLKRVRNGWIVEEVHPHRELIAKDRMEVLALLDEWLTRVEALDFDGGEE